MNTPKSGRPASANRPARRPLADFTVSAASGIAAEKSSSAQPTKRDRLPAATPQDRRQGTPSDRAPQGGVQEGIRQPRKIAPSQLLGMSPLPSAKKAAAPKDAKRRPSAAGTKAAATAATKDKATAKKIADARPQDSETPHPLEEVTSAAAQMARDYRSWLFEQLKINMNASLDYASSLASMNSPVDLAARSAGDPREGKKASRAAAKAEAVPDSAKAAVDYRAKAFELVRANLNTTLEYAQRLADVTSAAEFIALSTRKAREQFEAMSAQSAELRSLAQTLAASNVEEMSEGIARVFAKRKD